MVKSRQIHFLCLVWDNEHNESFTKNKESRISFDSDFLNRGLDLWSQSTPHVSIILKVDSYLNYKSTVTLPLKRIIIL